MSVINILSPHVADLIAAGEVVERPASVVKELAENSLDAGAKNITIEIRGGGAEMVRVSDDGCGMSPEDAGVAFLRHATSKLHSESDLEAIRTMGFRGEALAAISAVSKITLSTRLRGSTEGTLVTLEGGDITDMTSFGCPEGTRMEVRDLFYNTPARQKFMKSDRAEASACQSAALRCALAHPEVSFRFIRDGEEAFFSPGDGRQDSCLYSLLGREVAADMLACKGGDAAVSVSGYVSSPSAGRGNRSAQYFFCNGRAIRSQLLQAALEQAYRNRLLTGRYPACVLYLTLSYGSVDVNVHPAKTEVKFSDERRVFDAVYYAVLSALSREDRTVAPADELKEPVKPSPSSGVQHSVPEAPRNPSFSSSAPFSESPRKPFSLRAQESSWQTELDLSAVRRTENSSMRPVPPVSYAPAVQNPVQNVDNHPFLDHKIVGEAMKTYILVERGDDLIVIDKHAAHERMIFDRLKAADRPVMAQTLLTPVTIRTDGEDAELLEQNEALFASLGFEIEPYGQDTFVVRALPADLDASDAEGAVGEICASLRKGDRPDPADARDEVLHTVACRAAIKAGKNHTAEELERVVTEVLSGRVLYCPHGRPVSAVITKRELDRLFKRIV